MVKIELAKTGSFEMAWQLLYEYFEEVGVIVRDTPSTVLASLKDPHSGIWIASYNCEPAGCIALRPLKDSTGEVKRLFVRPAYSGKGIASHLLQALELHATANKLQALYLDTKDDLTDAIAFYGRAGYQRCARYNDNPQATIFMKKDLLPI